MRYLFFQILLFIFYLPSPVIYAQDIPAQADIVDTLALQTDIFEEDEPMVITMKFNIKEYQRDKIKGEYMPAELIYHVNDTMDIYKTIRLKARGNFRRDFCTMPPLWLNIRKAEISNKKLQGIKRMKVVTHCKGGKAASNYILKEYMAYRIYNMLSPYSFRVRLVRMKYIDTGRKNKTYENWAFIIEPEDLLVQRYNIFPVNNDRLGMVHMLEEDMDRVALFNYMIGNADYSIAGRHNVKLVAHNETGVQGFIPVPYDFDYSGLVNAYYAVPGENLGIESVRERYYLGLCRDSDDFMETLDLFEEKKEGILSFVDNFPYLDTREKSEPRSYLEEFYRMAAKPESLYRITQSTCRQKQ